MLQIKHLQPYQYFATGQIISGICLLACLILAPQYFFTLDQGGISNYGTEPQTNWLYLGGFSAAALGTFIAAITIPQSWKRRLQLRFILLILSTIYVVIMISTFSYKLSPLLQQIHELSALVLFIGMLFICLWIRFIAIKDNYTNRLFILFCAFLVLGVFNYLGVLHILFVIEVATATIFAPQLTHCLQILAER